MIGFGGLVGTAAAILSALTLTGTAAAATPVGQWAFDEGTGTAAADKAGVHPATLRGGAAWTTGLIGPSALSVNGTTAFADAGAPVIDTSQSFTVSAWVKLTRISGYQTAVSVDGDTVSSFFLGLRDDTKRFAFVRLAGDSTQSGVVTSGTTDPVVNRWYLLTGVYDATASTLSLYVNGKLQASQAAPPGWRATGNLVIGRGKYGGASVDWVSGAIDDVRVYQSALPAEEIGELVNSGNWRLDEGSGTTAADGSANHLDLTLNSGASWTPGAIGASALLFNGTSGAAEAPGPVIDTSQGFSVAAWVRTDSANGFRTAVGVDGSQISGFFLQRRGDGKFAFARIATDAPGAALASASAETARVGQWYHLVGVYDGTSLTLYVNGTRQASVTAPTAWKATGHFVIGRGKYGGAAADFWQGAIDDVRTFPTAIDDAAASALASSGVWHFDENTGTIARDASPARDDGTVSGGWTAGVAGSALAGTADMGSAPSLNFGTGSYSISAWMRTTTDGLIAGKGGGYSLGVVGGKLRARLGALDVTSTSGGLADGNWHHVAVTVDRGAQRLTLYADGDTVGESPVSGQAADSAAAFTVGQGLTGGVDELSASRFALTAAQVAAAAGTNTITVDADDVRASTRATAYGSILEDISHSVEGGLYAELVRNRAFQESGSGAVPFWTFSAAGGAAGSFAIDTTQPLNSAITRALKLHADSLPAGGRVAAANDGLLGREGLTLDDLSRTVLRQGAGRLRRPRARDAGEGRRHGARRHHGVGHRRRLRAPRVHDHDTGRRRRIHEQPDRGRARVGRRR